MTIYNAPFSNNGFLNIEIQNMVKIHKISLNTVKNIINLVILFIINIIFIFATSVINVNITHPKSHSNEEPLCFKSLVFSKNKMGMKTHKIQW